MRRQNSLQALRIAALLGLAFISVPATAQTNLGSVNIGDSKTATVTVSIANSGTLASVDVVTQGVPDLDFANANVGSCATGTAYIANATCTVSVIFSPKSAATHYGAVVLADASGNVLGTSYLQGAGVGPEATFLPATPSALPNSLGVPFNLAFAVDLSGNVYIAYVGNTSVSKGTLQPNGSFDWTPIGSGFNNPYDVAVDGAGNVYVLEGPSSGGSMAVYKETLSGGSYTQSMIAEGFPVTLTMTVDEVGNVYIPAQGEDNATTGIDIPTAVYKEALQPDGSYIQTTIGSGWISLGALAVDGSGNLYVPDAGSVPSGGNIPAAVYKEALQPDGSYIQTTVGTEWYPLNGIAVDAVGNVYIVGGECSLVFFCTAGAYKESLQPGGSYSESSIGSGWISPAAVAVDGALNVYVIDGGSGLAVGGIRPTVSREALQQNGSYTHGTVGSGWYDPQDLGFVTVDGLGNVYVADYVKVGSFNLAIFKEDLAGPPTLNFDSTAPGSTSADSPQTVTVFNLGNQALNFSETGYPADFPELAGAAGDCTSSSSLAPGASCTLTIDFTPQSPLSGNPALELSEAVTVTTDTLNSTATQQTVTVNGTETNQVAATPVFSVPPGTYTTVQTVTITDSTPNAVIYYTTNGTTPTSGSTQYTGAIEITASETIEAIALAPNYIDSARASVSYTINLPMPAFSISGTAVSVAPGATTGNTSTITVTPSDGFTGTVVLTATYTSSPPGAILLPGFSFSAYPVITGTGAVTSTLTIFTVAPASATASPPTGSVSPWYAVGGATFACIFLVGIPARRRRWQSILGLLVLLVALLSGVLSCGSGGGASGGGGGSGANSGTVPGAYTITVSGTSGAITETGTVALTVQ
jgi:large repetitive protein